jgi:hypothetical protein
MAYVTLLIVISSIVIPVLLTLGLVLGYRKWQDRDGRRSPIEGRVIYGPGEQLRKRADDHGDEIMGAMAVMFFLGPYFLAFWALRRVDLAKVTVGLGDYIIIAAFLVVTTGMVWRIFKHGKERRRAIAGLKAELYTAQELNRLMGLGCTVLHDVPAENFNLDHVVIGPRAVYAVETKSVRKPRATSAKDHFKVTYDGQCLRFPDFNDSKRLQQTKRQADWLANYLRQATGKQVPVVPALALPGWWIEVGISSATSDVRVFNPAGRGAHFMADRTAPAVDSGTVALITQALVMRYPTETSAKK